MIGLIIKIPVEHIRAQSDREPSSVLIKSGWCIGMRIKASISHIRKKLQVCTRVD